MLEGYSTRVSRISYVVVLGLVGFSNVVVLGLVGFSNVSRL